MIELGYLITNHLWTKQLLHLCCLIIVGFNVKATSSMNSGWFRLVHVGSKVHQLHSFTISQPCHGASPVPPTPGFSDVRSTVSRCMAKLEDARCRAPRDLAGGEGNCSGRVTGEGLARVMVEPWSKNWRLLMVADGWSQLMVVATIFCGVQGFNNYL